MESPAPTCGLSAPFWPRQRHGSTMCLPGPRQAGAAAGGCMERWAKGVGAHATATHWYILPAALSLAGKPEKASFTSLAASSPFNEHQMVTRSPQESHLVTWPRCLYPEGQRGWRSLGAGPRPTASPVPGSCPALLTQLVFLLE